MPTELQASKIASKKRRATTVFSRRTKQKMDVDLNQILSKLEGTEKTESDAEDDTTGLYCHFMGYTVPYCYFKIPYSSLNITL